MKYILFPHTNFVSLHHLPFFLLTRQIQIFRVTTQETGSGLADCFMKAGFCQAELLPFTNSNEEYRFLNLIRELRNRPDDLPYQLSALTIAGNTMSPEDGEQSNRAIRKTIEGDRPDKSQQERKEVLWQARLLLSMGEIVDQKEEEAAMQLAEAERSTRKLLAELQGDEEADSPVARQQYQRRPPYSGDHKHLAPRVNAWRRLLADKVTPKDIFLAPVKAAAEQLMDEYEQEAEEPGIFLGELLLPAVIGNTAQEALLSLMEFYKKYPLLQERLLTPVWSEEFQQEWNLAMDDLFPIQPYGRQKIAGMLFDNPGDCQLPYPERIFYATR